MACNYHSSIDLSFFLLLRILFTENRERLVEVGERRGRINEEDEGRAVFFFFLSLYFFWCLSLYEEKKHCKICIM